MVNHFATLLSNTNLNTGGPIKQNYLLSGTDTPGGVADFLVSDINGTRISLGTFLSSASPTDFRSYSPFVYRHYSPIPLPAVLEKFHAILFPDSASFFYRQYLLYCYLKLIDSTGWAERVKIYDPRITYELSEVTEYFRYYRNSQPVCNNPKYTMLLTGNIRAEDDINSYQNNFVIRQASDPQSLYVYSLTQKKYYKEGLQGSRNHGGMEVPVELAAGSSTTSKIIRVGDTGLSFYITGNFGPAPDLFTEGNNVWAFSAEAPLLFDYKQKINELTVISSVVDDMLEYHRDHCTPDYVNLWNSHHNSVYRFAGLLMAYVERVNILWQKRQM